MLGAPQTFDDWRAFLRTSEIDVFETIENAILIAAADFPDKFLEKKDLLMLTISTAFSCRSQPQRMGSETKDEFNKNAGVEMKKMEKGKRVGNFNEDEINHNNCSKRRKKNVASTKHDDNAGTSVFRRIESQNTQTKWSGKDVVMIETDSSMHNVIGTVNDRGAEKIVAKVVEVEREVLGKESIVLRDVCKIKDALMIMKDQPAIVLDLLTRLEKMNIDLDVLKATGIAAIVSSFKTNESIEIRQLASSLTESWGILFDEWISHKNATLSSIKEVVVGDIKKVTIAVNKPEPKSSIGAGSSSIRRTGSIRFSEGPSKSRNSEPLVGIGIGSRCPANIDGVTVAAIKTEPRCSVKAGPSLTKRTGSTKISEGPSKPQSSERFTGIGYSSPATNINKVMVAARKAEPKFPTGAGPSSTKITGIINSSEGPSHGPSKQPQSSEAPFVHIGSRDPANTNKGKVAAQEGEPKFSIGAGPSLTRRTSTIKSFEGPSKPQSSEKLVDIAPRGPTNGRCIVVGQPAKLYPPNNRGSASATSVRSGGTPSTSLRSQPRSGLQEKEKLDDVRMKKMEVPPPAEKIEEDPVKENLKIAKRKLQERLQKSAQTKRQNMGPQNADKDTPIAKLLSQYRQGPR